MKIAVIIGLILVIMLFQGCSVEHQYSFSQPLENIEQIDIIHEPPYETIRLKDLCNLDAVVTIESDQWSEFISDFREIPCDKYFLDPACLIDGYTIRIAYNDGGYEYICKYSGLHIKADGDWKYPSYYFDSDLFDNFINTTINEFSKKDSKTGDGFA